MFKRGPQAIPLKDRLAAFAAEVRAKAALLPPSLEKDDLSRRARQADTAAHIDEWINSAGLQPPNDDRRRAPVATGRAAPP